MIHTTARATSAPKSSNSQASLVAGIHFEEEGVFVDFDNSPVKVIHGEGVDEGTVALQIGGACIWFSSLAGLIAQLTGADQAASTRHKPVAIVS